MIFLANLLRVPVYYFFRKIQYLDRNKIKRILLLRNDQIGDMVLTLPLIQYLKQINKDFEIDILARKYQYDVISENPLIRHIILQDAAETPEMVAEKLNKSHYDIAFCLVISKASAKLWKLIRCDLKLAYAYTQEPYSACNRFVFVHRRKAPVIHESRFCCKFPEALGWFADYEKAVHDAKIHVPEGVAGKIEKYVKDMHLDPSKKTVAIHPASFDETKNWPIENYLDLGGKLKSQYNVIFTFGPGEIGLLDAFSSLQKEKFRFVRGDLTVKEYACFCEKVDLLISSNTGPMHLAGIMGTRTLSLFENKGDKRLDQKWHPIRNEYRLLIPDEPLTEKNRETHMRSITVDMILEAVREFKGM